MELVLGVVSIAPQGQGIWGGEFCLPATFCTYRSLSLPSTWSALMLYRELRGGVDGKSCDVVMTCINSVVSLLLLRAKCGG